MAIDRKMYCLIFAIFILLPILFFTFKTPTTAPAGESKSCPVCVVCKNQQIKPEPTDVKSGEQLAAEKLQQMNQRGLWRAQGGQDKFMYEKVFWPMTEPGVFVEFGARNGEEHSNSYFYEKALNWTGLLVEANPAEIPGIKERRPGSLVLHGGICNKNGMIEFSLTDKATGLSAQTEHHTNRFPQFSKKVYKVPCYKLNDVLDAAGFTKIDYMTVDTEGSELSILEAFDFHRFAVGVIQVETIGAETERRVGIDKLMFSKGYKIFGTIELGNDTLDVIYKRTPQADLLKFSQVKQNGWPSNFDSSSNIKRSD